MTACPDRACLARWRNARPDAGGGRAQFRTTLLSRGKTATSIEVPAQVVEGLGAGKRPAVRVTMAGHTYRSTVAVMGGVFMIGVSADVRRVTGLAAGDEVDVTVEHDAAPRSADVPPDLAAALATEPVAQQRFDALSFSRQQVLRAAGDAGQERRDPVPADREDRRHAAA